MIAGFQVASPPKNPHDHPKSSPLLQKMVGLNIEDIMDDIWLLPWLLYDYG